MEMEIERGRFGEFLVFIGLILLVVFFTTGQSHTPAFELLIGGLLTTLIGFYFIWRDWKPPGETTRFPSLRRWRARSREKKERKKK